MSSTSQHPDAVEVAQFVSAGMIEHLARKLRAVFDGNDNELAELVDSVNHELSASNNPARLEMSEMSQPVKVDVVTSCSFFGTGFPKRRTIEFGSSR